MELRAAEKMYMQLNAEELEAIKRDTPSSNDRDAGFCSASSESEGGEDIMLENAHITTSIEYNDIEGYSIEMLRNKRKRMEPARAVYPLKTKNNCESLAVISCNSVMGPLKKRIRYSSSVDSAVVLTPPALQSPPFIDCSHSSPTQGQNSSKELPREAISDPAHVFVRHPGVTTLHRAFNFGTQPEQLEPLALIARKSQTNDNNNCSQKIDSKFQYVEGGLSSNQTPSLVCEIFVGENIDEKNDNNSSLSRPQLRNYKNMTRERRIEANARERTRVHTISAAYETLRRAVPAYASSQKLSKLSVLRVACSYILTLSRMAGKDYSADCSEPTVAECIETINSTIQTEGKVKRKKED